MDCQRRTNACNQIVTVPTAFACYAYYNYRLCLLFCSLGYVMTTWKHFIFGIEIQLKVDFVERLGLYLSMRGLKFWDGATGILYV